jgi:Xaa-Pro aminopeptidase
MKDGLSETPSKENWLLSEAANGAYRVAYDPLLISVKGRADMVEAFKKKNSKLEMVSLKDNLVDHVWADQRPKRTENPVFVLDEKFTGESVASKLKRLREALTGSFIVTALDEVAWLLNLRGNDIPYNPVFFSYVLVTPNDATLYTNPSRVPADVKKYLETAKVALKPYENVFSDLHSLSFSESKKLLATNSCNCAVEDAVNGHLEIIRSPIMLFKAVKNTSELKGFEECHKRDAAALCNFFGWLEHELLSGKKINECEAADKAEELRSKQDLFMGLSFDTISSTGANAAIIHYSPKPESCATINKDEIFLFDSGEQSSYLCSYI